MWSASVKAKAISLRKQGYSYGRLVEELGISKSTIFEWVGPIKRPGFTTPEDRSRWARSIQHLGVEAIQQKRQKKLLNIDNRIEKELDHLTLNISQKKLLIAMLYWAEGSKGRHDNLTIANTDPQLLLMYITLLRECFELDESKFRLRLHIHDYHNEDEQKNYWSGLLAIPLNQFQKSYRKPRSINKHFRENSHGICFLRYNNIDLKEELLRLGLAISGKITGEKNALVA